MFADWWKAHCWEIVVELMAVAGGIAAWMLYIAVREVVREVKGRKR